jgi:hypothetical protein
MPRARSANDDARMSRLPAPLPSLTAYRNRGGDSGVAAYALLDHALIVQFDDGATYLYGPVRPGRHHVGRMKSLAMAGRGLDAYIRRYVRDKHEMELAPRPEPQD